MTARWAIEWNSQNMMDGKRRFLMWGGSNPYLFRTRREANAFISAQYGYIANRPDLRQEPHGWQMPKPPVKVEVELKTERGEP